MCCFTGFSPDLKLIRFKSCVLELVQLQLVIELNGEVMKCVCVCDWSYEASKTLCRSVFVSVCVNETSRRLEDRRGIRVCPRRHVCVTYLSVGGDQSPVDYCRCRRAAAFDGSASPTLGTLRSYTDGVINGRRAREGNLSLISTFAPDCHLC